MPLAARNQKKQFAAATFSEAALVACLAIGMALFASSPSFGAEKNSVTAAPEKPVILNYSRIAGPGDLINLQGHAFGVKPEVWCSIAEAKLKPLVVVNAGNNIVHTKLPMQKGNFRLQIRNGQFASDILTLRNRPLDASSRFDSNRLARPARVSNLTLNVCTDTRLHKRAAGDGTNNDQAAIQEGIDLIATSGGGTVILPAGTYKLEKASGPLLNLRSNVVLQGAGLAATTINFGYSKAAHDSCLLMLDKVSNCAVCDLSLENISTNNDWLNAKTITAPQSCNQFSFSRVKGNLKNAFRIELKGDQILVNDCQLKSLYTLLFMSTCTNSQVRDNTITQMLGVNLDITKSKNCLVLNNKLILDANNGAVETGNVRHGMAIDFAHNLAIINNTWSTINGEPTINNDGEAVLSEGGGDIRAAEETGKIVSCDASQRSGLHASHCQLSKNGEFVDGSSIAIISGRGLGQWRPIESRKGNSIEIEKPWAVLPDQSSNYAIFIWSNQNTLIIGNSFSGWPRGIWLYQASTIDTQISHNQLSKMDGIFIEPCQNSARDKGQFNPVWNTVIDHNYLSSGKVATYINLTADLQQTTELIGTMALNNQIYKNDISRNGSKSFANDPANFEGYCNYLRVEAAPYEDKVARIPAILGTIFQENKISDSLFDKVKPAYLLNGGAWQTTIDSGSRKGSDMLIEDSTYYWNTPGTHRSTNTVLLDH